MPKEHRKRGRRAEQKKRKLDQPDEEPSSKRRRQSNDHEHQDFVPLDAAGDEQPPQQDATAGASGHPGDSPFYGMLDDEEQEYFRRADEMLELNQFSDPEDRSTFLASVYKEAEGKELKLANSQSCSRLMERLIQLSTVPQLKGLFQKFSGNFLHLVQHRFASHCCEALFIQAAPTVTAEIVAPPTQTDDPNDVIVSMEDLYLHAIHELEGYLGYLLTDKFASHTLRVLLVVLAGQPLAQSATASLVRSKKKEHVSVTSADKKQEMSLEQRNVPDSFMQALEKIITESLSGLDSTYIRALATHPTGNPTLQLLLQLELSKFGKQRAKDENSIIHKLLPDDAMTEDTDSAKFINGMIYDPVGSRLLETIIEFAPGKMFKSIYKNLFKERLASLARNDVASYIVSKILCRLGKEDLAEATKLLCSQIHMLVDRNRTVVIKTLVERCQVRDVDTTPIATALEAAYGGSNGFDITHLLRLNKANSESSSDAGKESGKNNHQSDKLHGSLLAQAMIAVPGTLSNLIFESLARLGSPLSLTVAKDPSASHTIQAALAAPTASIIFRRKMIQQFYGHVGEMALDPSASHVIDAIWTGTHGLAFIRERVAEELAENEASLRESFVGRAVWRNWKMDLYKRRRRDWVIESRKSAGSDGFLGFPEANGDDDENKEPKGKGKEKEGEVRGKHMTAIEKARIKHAEAKTKREMHATSSGKGKEKERSTPAVTVP